MDKVRVVVADDHPMFREGLRRSLSSQPDIEVVSDVGSGADVVAAALAGQPDVVVMDLRMPGVNGIDATREIVAVSPHVAVLVLTMFDDDESVFAAMRAGARGYLLKEADEEEIVRAVRAVACGEAIFGPALAHRITAYFAGAGNAGPPHVFPQLTDREREVLDLVAQGLSNTAIAGRLYLSPRTVRNHVSNIFTKLAVAGRAEAIVRARDAGLGLPGKHTR